MNNLKSIIIVTFNNARTIIPAIDSVFKHVSKPFEIIVVDNNSSDKTGEIITQKYEHKVDLLEQPDNLGYGKANNIGVNNSTGKYIMLLNPDTIILDKSINQLFLEVDKKDVGIAAPALVDQNNQVMPTVRKLPTLRGAFNEYVVGTKNSYDFYIPTEKTPVNVEYLVGAVMVLRRDLFLKIGLFDEKYFLYYEDIDLCNRVKSLGKKILYISAIKVFHEVGVSGKTNPKTKNLNIESAKIYHGEIKYFLFDLIFLYVRLKRKLGLAR